jgi:hypothetical protein
MRIDDVYPQNRRLWLRLQEKGGKQHAMPCHHNLETYLHEYLDGASLANDPKADLQPCYRFARRERWPTAREGLGQGGQRSCAPWHGSDRLAFPGLSEGQLSMSEIKSEHTDGVIRREWVSGECARQPEQPAVAVHPCSEIMCPCAIVIVHISKEHMAQVPLAEYDDMTFPPDRANQPFPMSILPWRLGRVWAVTNAHGAKPPDEKCAVDPVAIADDVARCAFPAAGSGELPGNPFGSGCAVAPSHKIWRRPCPRISKP